MTLRFVGMKVLGALATLLFVIVFNFFLFRVVENDPVGTLVRGRNLTEEQQDRLAEDFGVVGRAPEERLTEEVATDVTVDGVLQ